MVVGPRSGTNFLLDAAAVNRLGRGIDCHIVLTDPMCSRVHAELTCQEGQWRVRDAESRNGTFLDGKKIDEADLAVGARLRVGSTEFTFHHGAELPTLSVTRVNEVTESIVREASVDADDSGEIALATLLRAKNVHELGILFQLSLKLLGCEDPLEVQRITLELLHERTSAAVAGFLWVTEEGELKPQTIIPLTTRGRISLSRTLTSLVLEQRRAVWVANQENPQTGDSLKAYADALCVPVIQEGKVLGALHIYLGQGQFRDIDFDFAITVAQVFGVALARTRKQARLSADHARLAHRIGETNEILGDSESVRRLRSLIERVASATGPVLVSGESGSGKELVARAIHRSSPRADRPILSVNCSAIPAELVESHLFGHVKGAFTGAMDERKGWFQQAHTGTLFLDEIGELPLEAQSKLLRVLEGHAFLPVGGSQEVQVDVRVLAATNRDLRQEVKDKRFREDLYYRLSVFELHVPPLRDRGRDIEFLLEHFLKHFRSAHGRLGIKLTDSARKVLLEYRWPGNIRQLRNVIDSAVVLADGNEIRIEDLGLRDAGTDELETLRIDDWERKLIRRALDKTHGSVPEAAQLLGIGRATLYRKIEEYGIRK